MSKPIDQERELFEAHYHLATLNRDPISGAYYDSETRCLWDAWQARASVQPAGGAVQQVDIVAWLNTATGDTTTHEVAVMDWDDENEPVQSLMTVEQHTQIVAAMIAAPHPVSGERLSVWEGPMPESNGKTNYTAILHKGDISEGITIARSEYPDRVRYEADEARWLIGERAERPYILDYDADKHSGYTPPPKQAAQDVAGLVEAVRDYLSAVHEQLPNPLKVTAAMLQMKKALAAHRAQAQGGSK